jgi:N-acetylmuramoyl-L-alanine amidase
MYIKKSDLGSRRDADFFEADLTWRTARILGKRLEAQGAIVFIPRKKKRSVLGMTYPKWKRKEFVKTLEQDKASGRLDDKAVEWYLKEAPEDKIYSYMTRKDLEARADKINAFQPHLTINIHYNASGSELREDGYFAPIANNYSMIFTGGGFMKGELGNAEARMHFLRLLLAEDLEESIRLSSEIIQTHTDIVRVKPVAVNNDEGYLNNNSVYSGKTGVYCRNLALTRTIRGPLCFGESLMQDHVTEAPLLNRRDYREGGVRIPGRLKLVIDAYEAGIKAYVRGGR